MGRQRQEPGASSSVVGSLLAQHKISHSEWNVYGNSVAGSLPKLPPLLSVCSASLYLKPHLAAHILVTMMESTPGSGL